MTRNYIKYRNGIRIDMMGNYHGGCKNTCCQNAWGFPTEKGINNNCNTKQIQQVLDNINENK